MGKINDVNDFSMETFKDHAELIKDSDERKAKFEEKCEETRIENSEIAKKIEEVEKQNERELTLAEEEYENNTAEYGERFKD